MFDHPDFAAPPDEAEVWRYVDLNSMLAMLSGGKLHFTRLDKYKDKWEGVWPDANCEQIRNDNPADLAEWILDNARQIPTHAHVNCWHNSTYESAALWDQYGQSTGLAIKTTILALREAIQPQHGIIIGSVEYVHFDAITQAFGVRNSLRPIFLKRKSFEHEREVRLLKWYSPKADSRGQVAEPDTECGSDIDVDLERLFGAVYLSPTSPAWLLPHIERLFAAFDLPDVEIRRSKLYDPA